ncbi:MAG: hypothetical protein ACYDBJ_24530, partial [Aggregatilineales bacterium]
VQPRLGAELSRIPDGIKSMVEKGGTNNSHTLEATTRPTHSWTAETVFELFDSPFSRSGANWEAIGAKDGIEHPIRMRFKISRMVAQLSVVEGLANLKAFTAKHMVFERFRPTLGSSWISRAVRLSSGFEMLSGRIPIHNLDSAREQVIGQMPNPRCAVGSDSDLTRIRDSLLAG